MLLQSTGNEFVKGDAVVQMKRSKEYDFTLASFEIASTMELITPDKYM